MDIMINGTFISLSATLMFLSGMATAQTSQVACESQQSLEQTLTSDGAIMPDDCRTISIERLTSDGRDLCLVDLSESGGGIISDLRDVAAPAEWWFACDELEQLTATGR
ncbi:MAG: hypothetical protein ACNA7O_08170 [Rhodobacterales bacterium]